MSSAIITKTIFLAASPDVVWPYLTSSEKLAKWFHPAEADLKLGEDYALMNQAEDGSREKICWGTVLEMDPPSILVYSFAIGPLSLGTTTVSWQLEAVHGGTMLSLKHEGIGEAAGEAALNILMALDNGWDKHFAGLRSSLN